jgi:uncharacterized coiled-coil protein SlyX
MSKNKSAPTKTVETGNDLDQLRDILYGNQARATENRLGDLETRVETVRRELNQEFNDRITALADSSSSQFDSTNKKITDQLAKQQSNQEAQNQSLQEKIIKLSADLSQQLEKQINGLNQQLTDFRTETRQRHDDLRQEMLTIGAMLDKQKAGRNELGQLLIELGSQLQNNAVKTPDSDSEAG